MAAEGQDVATFGSEIPDQYTSITECLSTHLHTSHDLSSYLSERAALEREYSSKLSALNRKLKEKREKRLMEHVVGPEPAKIWNTDVSNRSTLQTYLNSAISASESITQDHLHLATGLDSLSNQIESAAKKGEEMRKKHNAFYQKLISDREKTCGERIKAKSKYDESCHELEKERAKGGDNDKAKKSLQAAEEEMWNAKNTYLVSISASNRAQSRFYTEDLPTIQDDLQSLLTLSDKNLAEDIRKWTGHIASHGEQLAEKGHQVENNVQSVDLGNDHSVFMEFNRRRFDMPTNFAFEPCQGFFDTEEMSTDSTSSKTFLENMVLTKQGQLSELMPMIESKSKEITGLKKLQDAYLNQRSLGDPNEVTDKLLDSIRQSITLEITASLLASEIETIFTDGKIDSETFLSLAKPHLFEPKNFTIPTNCQLCQSKIHYLNKGLICKSCSFTCHLKCQPKVPANCRAAAARGGSTQTNQLIDAQGLLGRSSSVRHGHTAPGSSARQLPPSGPSRNSSTTPSSVANPSGPSTRAIYSYDATASNEVSIQEGEVLTITQESDGSGWITVTNSNGDTGLVPENYTQSLEDEESDDDDDDDEGAPSGTIRVKVLYDYTSASPDELSIIKDEVITLTSIGFDIGNGWCQGVNTSGEKGVFPANYVEQL
ncbi:unnamed protein product [Sympodiomycopsis kandeliae]